MHRIEIDLEDWEWVALSEMAGEREIDPAAMARKLGKYGIQARVGRVFESLVFAGTISPSLPRRRDEAIEHRLGRLFEE